MDRNEAKLILEVYLYELSNQTGSEWCRKKYEAIQEAIKALEQQPDIIRCKDCKYNVSSHKCLHPESFFLVPSNDFYCGYSKRRSDAVNNTKNKTREARWIINSDGYYPYCSACMTEPQNGEMADYCPNCGAKMKK